MTPRKRQSTFLKKKTNSIITIKLKGTPVWETSAVPVTNAILVDILLLETQYVHKESCEGRQVKHGLK